MLPRTAYFKVLASLGNAQTPEWHATVAGLVTLRLVDDWLDFGPYNHEHHEEDFRIVRSLIAKVPHTHSLQSLLKQIVFAIEKAEHVATQIVARPMLEYVESLECTGKFALAHDVLRPLQIRAEQTGDIRTTVRASLRLGFVLRTLSQWDLALNDYQRAIHYATKGRDTPTALMAIIGKSKVIAICGDWERGYETVRSLLPRAENLAAGELIAIILHDLAQYASMRDDHQTAIPLYYQAIERTTPGTRSSEHVVADLAGTLIFTDDIVRARALNIKLALTAQSQTVRWQATICLMVLSARERQAENFERYRSALELVPLTPWLAVAYRRYAAEGYRIFGNERKVQEERQEVDKVARQHGIHPSYTEEDPLAQTDR